MLDQAVLSGSRKRGKTKKKKKKKAAAGKISAFSEAKTYRTSVAAI